MCNSECSRAGWGRRTISAPEERPSGMKPNLLPWLAKPSGSVCRGLLAVIVLIYTHRLILKPIMKQGVHAEAYISA